MRRSVSSNYTKYENKEKWDLNNHRRSPTSCTSPNPLNTFVSACGERVLPDNSYLASSNSRDASLARLNSSNPQGSLRAWCRGVNDPVGFIQLNLGKNYFFSRCISSYLALGTLPTRGRRLSLRRYSFAGH